VIGVRKGGYAPPFLGESDICDKSTVCPNSSLQGRINGDARTKQCGYEVFLGEESGESADHEGFICLLGECYEIFHITSVQSACGGAA
jgi:hypothetical protein